MKTLTLYVICPLLLLSLIFVFLKKRKKQKQLPSSVVSVNKELDKLLVFIYENQHTVWPSYFQYYKKAFELVFDSVFPSADENILIFNFHKKYLSAVIDKLKSDDLITVEAVGQYSIFLTVKGREFLDNTLWPYKKQPYSYISFKEKLKTVWNFVKIIAAIINALALLYLGWLQVKGH